MLLLQQAAARQPGAAVRRVLEAAAHLHRDGVHVQRLALQLPAPRRARPPRPRPAARHVSAGSALLLACVLITLCFL